MTREYVLAAGLRAIGCVCGEKESVRRELRFLLDGLRRGHPGVLESIVAALGNVNPYMLLDPTLSKAGADSPAAFAGTQDAEPVVAVSDYL